MDQKLMAALALAPKIAATNAAVSAVMIERQDILTAFWVITAADCAGFLLGDPGVAKTETVEILSTVLAGVECFTALMPAVGSPQAMFVQGISVRETALPDGSKELATKEMPGRAATAHIVLLDETWKVKSPEVLNGLLDLTRSGGVRHEGKKLDDHARMVMGISNETPEPGGDNDALLARYILRVPVRHLELPGLKRMVRAQIERDRNGGGKISVPNPLTLADLDTLQAGRPFVEVSDSILEIVYQVITDLNDRDGEEFRWLVTDNRRFGYMVRCLQAHALINGRAAVSTADLTVLRWMLWNSPEQIPAVEALVDLLCRTPFGECQELVDKLLAAGGIVDQVCQGQAQQAANALVQVNACERQLVEKAKALQGTEATKVASWVPVLATLKGVIAGGFGGSIDKAAALTAYNAVKAALV